MKIFLDTAPLRITAYRRLWSSTVVTSVGGQLTAVTVPVQIYDLTKSSAEVGIAGAVALVPLLVFSLIGGALADMVDRRVLMLVTNSGIAVTSALFCVQAALHNHAVGLIFVILAVQVSFLSVNIPTRNASVAALVPEFQRPAASALSSTTTGFGLIFGPMAAGPLIPLLGIPSMYLLDTIGLSFALWAVWRLPALRALDSDKPRSPVRRFDVLIYPLLNALRGIRFIVARRLLLAAFLSDLIAMVFGMPRALFPELAQTTFASSNGNGIALGLLYAGIPLGGVVMGFFSGLFTSASHQGLLLSSCLFGWAVAVALLGMSSSLPIAVAFLVLAGAADFTGMVIRSAITQTDTPDGMMGRVQGAATLVSASGPRLADLIHGTVGAGLGPSRTIVGGAIIVVVFTALLTWRMPVLRRYRLVPQVVGQ